MSPTSRPATCSEPRAGRGPISAGDWPNTRDAVTWFPDDLVFALLMPAVVAAARDTGGYLLDGFPRTLAQARRLTEIGLERDLVTDAVVYLRAPDAVLVERLLDRAAREGRADDRPDVIRHRLAVFAEDTAPVVGYYRDRGVLIEVDADRPVDAIRTELRQRLADRGVPALHPA